MNHLPRVFCSGCSQTSPWSPTVKSCWRWEDRRRGWEEKEPLLLLHIKKGEITGSISILCTPLFSLFSVWREPHATLKCMWNPVKSRSPPFPTKNEKRIRNTSTEQPEDSDLSPRLQSPLCAQLRPGPTSALPPCISSEAEAAQVNRSPAGQIPRHGSGLRGERHSHDSLDGLRGGCCGSRSVFVWSF